MSDTVKLIIEIPTDFYEITKAKVAKNMTHALYALSIAHGVPFSDVINDIKAEIDDLRNLKLISNDVLLNIVLGILDSIGKESEE